MAQHNSLRQEIIYELDFVLSIGKKIFLYPFIGKNKIQITGYFVTLILVLCAAIQLTLTFFSNNTDWLEITNVAPNLGVVFMTFMKYMKIHKHKKIYNEIFYHFRDEIWDIVEIRSADHQKIIKHYKWITVCINRFLLYYSIPLTVIVDSFPYIVMLYEEKFKGYREYLYPFDGWYPFDKIKWYAAAYIWESFMTAVVVVVYSFSNMIHTSFIIFICMELRILGSRLEELISPEDLIAINEKHYADHIHHRILRDLKMLIARHDFLTK